MKTSPAVTVLRSFSRRSALLYISVRRLCTANDPSFISRCLLEAAPTSHASRGGKQFCIITRHCAVIKSIKNNNYKGKQMNNARELLKEALSKEGKTVIKLLGDSITHGVGGTGFVQNGVHIVNEYSRNPDGYCWANLFKKYMEKKYNCEVLNNACTGTRIEFVLDHLDTLVSPEDDLVICTIGTNNRHQYFKDGPMVTPEEKREAFYKRVIELVGALRERGKRFILVANIPASPAAEKSGADFWRIIHMNDINDIYRRAEAELDFSFISMYELFSEYLTESGTPITELLGDGLHPNDRGYEVMFKLMGEALGIV